MGNNKYRNLTLLMSYVILGLSVAYLVFSQFLLSLLFFLIFGVVVMLYIYERGGGNIEWLFGKDI